MNKSITQLEKERIEKIKNLSLPEVKSYISHLNKKMYFASEKEDIDYYSDKIIETFDLIEKDYLIEAHFDYTHSQIDLLSSEVYKKSLRIKIFNASHSHEIFYDGYTSLFTELESLKSLFRIYYVSYVRQSNGFNHILEYLDEEHDFRNEDFDKYLRSYHLKDNHHLNYEFDLSIYRLIISMKAIIESLNKFEDRYDDEFIESEILRVESMIKDIEEKEYSDLLYLYLESLKYLKAFKGMYLEIKGEVLDYLSKDDGFLEEKEKYYNHYNYMMDSSERDEILKSNPFYDFEDMRLKIK